jgi:hypothetical protein
VNLKIPSRKCTALDWNSSAVKSNCPDERRADGGPETTASEVSGALRDRYSHSTEIQIRRNQQSVIGTKVAGGGINQSRTASLISCWRRE